MPIQTRKILARITERTNIGPWSFQSEDTASAAYDIPSGMILSEDAYTITVLVAGSQLTAEDAGTITVDA